MLEIQVCNALGCTPAEWEALTPDDQLELVRAFANTSPLIPAHEAIPRVLAWISEQGDWLDEYKF